MAKLKLGDAMLPTHVRAGMVVKIRKPWNSNARTFRVDEVEPRRVADRVRSVWLRGDFVRRLNDGTYVRSGSQRNRRATVVFEGDEIREILP